MVWDLYLAYYLLMETNLGERMGQDGIDFSLWEASLYLKVLERRWSLKKKQNKNAWFCWLHSTIFLNPLSSYWYVDNIPKITFLLFGFADGIHVLITWQALISWPLLTLGFFACSFFFLSFFFSVHVFFYPLNQNCWWKNFKQRHRINLLEYLLWISVFWK